MKMVVYQCEDEECRAHFTVEADIANDTEVICAGCGGMEVVELGEADIEWLKETKYSKEVDNQGKQWIACSECFAGGKGNQSCSTGGNAKRGGNHGCSLGGLRKGLKMREAKAE